MILTVLVASILGLAFLFMLGAAIYGIGLAAFDGLVELVQGARDRLPQRTAREQGLGPTATNPDILNDGKLAGVDPPQLSTEAMWHRMQGTSRKMRRRG